MWMIAGVKKYDIRGVFSLGRWDAHGCYRCERESSDSFFEEKGFLYFTRSGAKLILSRLNMHAIIPRTSAKSYFQRGPIIYR